MHLAFRSAQLDTLLCVVIEHRLVGKSSIQGGSVSDFPTKEAIRIGSSFLSFLLTCTEPGVAVDSWRLDNNTLQDLFDKVSRVVS